MKKYFLFLLLCNSFLSFGNDGYARYLFNMFSFVKENSFTHGFCGAITAICLSKVFSFLFIKDNHVNKVQLTKILDPIQKRQREIQDAQENLNALFTREKILERDNRSLAIEIELLKLNKQVETCTEIAQEIVKFSKNINGTIGAMVIDHLNKNLRPRRNAKSQLNNNNQTQNLLTTSADDQSINQSLSSSNQEGDEEKKVDTSINKPPVKMEINVNNADPLLSEKPRYIPKSIFSEDMFGCHL